MVEGSEEFHAVAEGSFDGAVEAGGWEVGSWVVTDK